MPATPMNRTTDHDGVRLAYALTGQGPPVLMIQGVGIGGAGWGPQVDALSDRYACLCFDNRGMGRSQRVDGRPPVVSVERMAADAAAVMDAAGWPAAHVVAHSLGGPVALQLAATSPGRVLSLALLCTFATGRAAAPPTPRMLWLGTRSRVGPRSWRRRAFLQLVMSPAGYAAADTNAEAARLAPFFGHDLADQPPIVGPQLKALRAADLLPTLGRVSVPTLVVSAAHDPIAPPAAGRALAAGIPTATYVELPDASHGVVLEQPARINALLADHLTGAQGVT